MSASYGAYLGEAGITDRATVLVGKDGQVLWSESVGPGGARVWTWARVSDRAWA